MPLPPKPRSPADVPACVSSTIEVEVGAGKDRDQAVAVAFQHCALPGAPRIMAAKYEAQVQEPGVQTPEFRVGDQVVRVPIKFTDAFFESVRAASPEVVPANVYHAGRSEAEVVGSARHFLRDGRWMAEFTVDPSTPHGAVTDAIVAKGIMDGVPVHVSFEVDDLEFRESDEEILAAAGTGTPIEPVHGVLGAISILPGVEGACGDACAISYAVAACKSGGSCGSECCGGETHSMVSFRGVLGAVQDGTQALKKTAPPTENGVTMTPEEQIAALQAKNTTLAAELATTKEALSKAEQEVTELRDATPADGMTPALRKELDDLKADNSRLLKMAEDLESDARDAVVAEIKEIAPEEFEVDAEAPMEVLAATLRAFKAAKPAEPVKAPTGPTIRAHANRDGQETGKETTVRSILAARAARFGDLPRALQRNGNPLKGGN